MSTNLDALRDKIKDIGIPITVIAKKTGIPRKTIYNRLRGRGEFRASEIQSLSNILRFSRKDMNDIFFAEERELNSHKNHTEAQNEQY